MTSIFLLSLGLTFIKTPFIRKWYSTSIGIFAGFYVYGFGYFIVIAMDVSVWPIMAFLPKQQAFWVGNAVAVTILTLSNLYAFWLGLGQTDFTFCAQVMQNFVKINMTFCNIKDSLKLDDKEKVKELTERERYHAEGLKEIPSFFDWFHY